MQYQQNYTVDNIIANTTAVKVAQEYAKLLENKFYLFNGSFYKWDFKENRWQNASEPVYSYVDYMTGVSYDWSQEANEWQKSNQQISRFQAATETNNNKNSSEQKLESKEKINMKKEGWVDVSQDKNTNVYVSGLPLDITDQEFEDMVSKYGIIIKDPLTNKLKLKLYRDEHNEVKGDGRCCYLMVKISLEFLKFYILI
jgi:HIV Tat-specific factor 1